VHLVLQTDLIKLCTVYEKKKSTTFLNFFYFLYYIFSPPPNFLNFGVDNCHQPVYIIYTNRLFGLTAFIRQFPIDNSGRRLLNVPPGLRLTHPRCRDQPLSLAIVQLLIFLSLPGKILTVFPFFNLFLFIIYVPAKWGRKMGTVRNFINFINNFSIKTILY